MRIGIDVSSAVNQTAGIGRYTNELVKHILKIENSDDYVLHSFFGDTRAFVERHKLKHGQLIDHGFNGKAFRTYLLALKLMGVTPDGLVKGTDVFHIPDFSFPALKTIKSVFTINDLIFLRYPEYFTRQNRIYMKQMSKFSADNAKAIIAISQSTKTDIINYLDIPEDKISVVYLAVGEQFKRADLETIETAKAKFGIDGQYLLYVGTLEPRKNITLLIEAFSIYCSHNKEFPLKLV
ncbi:MAG: glycosyltransferase family 4 protein, partial [Rubrobacteridae bacterium]|nr:glycosyltransferase family 4 protein [Rubrobacteridae bacterium]